MKKIISTSLVLLLVLGGISAAFAAETPKDEATSPSAATSAVLAAAETTTPEAIKGDTSTASAVTVIPDMNFTGTDIKLSLDDAYKKMLADSSGAKMADLNRQSADGVAKGYGESVQKINRARDTDGVFDSVSKAMAKLGKEYAATQGPKNYDAEMNDLKTKTFKNYYTLKEMENQLKIAEDNLALKEKLLSNTQLKYKLGTVSKNDVLKAEISVNEAKDKYLSASNGLKTLKMGFNQFMGYDLMQNVTLTDEIKEVPMSATSLSAAIKSALTNRNEIGESKFNLENAKLNLEQYASYPHSASKYIRAQMSLLKAETSFKNAPLTVESDVRNKYMEMNLKHAAVQTGKKSVEKAKEAERLAQLQYDAGMATLSDVEGAQIEFYTTQLDYSKALLEYNLAINDYQLSSGVGTTASVIP